MANNRMWLIHKPSKLGIMLGKRMGWGWYSPPTEERLLDFYEHLELNPVDSQDDFILAMEDCSESSCFNDWIYAGEKDGFHLFDFKAKAGMAQERGADDATRKL